MQKTKPDWDSIWYNLCYNVSLRSNDPRLQVGAVIVTEDNSCVLAIGYNGDEHGGKNKPDSLELGKSGFIHAEANALLKANYADYRNKKMYLTHSPCVVCARMIINGGIKKVIYSQDYRDSLGLNILKNAGIEVLKMPIWEWSLTDRSI